MGISFMNIRYLHRCSAFSLIMLCLMFTSAICFPSLNKAHAFFAAQNNKISFSPALLYALRHDVSVVLTERQYKVSHA